MSEKEKDWLIATVKRDFNTQRMKLADLWCEVELSHISDPTAYRALKECGIKAYH